VPVAVGVAVGVVQTMQPCTLDDLAPIFPMGIIEQEVSLERYIEIPEEVRGWPGLGAAGGCLAAVRAVQAEGERELVASSQPTHAPPAFRQATAL
jgi:hypothetical protein